MNAPVTPIQAPPIPRRLQALGLPEVFICDIVLKTMFRTHARYLTDIARAVRLPPALTQEIVDALRGKRMLEAMGTLHATSSTEMGYQLTEAGKIHAQESLAQSEYYGPMPVPLDHYAEQVDRQSIRNIAITRAQLTRAMGHLVLPDSLLDHLGPAVGSGRSVLLYGPPGNGKSSISNGIRDALGDRIYVPHAVAYGGQVIAVYDPVMHNRIAEAAPDPKALRGTPRADTRYILCERPTVITGGELRLNMLDLRYNEVARTYQAPLQMKAAGGVFIVDDLGRQEEPPQALMNRWIVPLEEGRDILSLQSGEKFEVPFDTLVIFSTNFHPNKIFDQAALRRIFYKIKVDGPSQANFLRIFALVADRKGLALNEDALLYLLREKYPTIDNVYANYQPNFLVDQMLSVCKFEGLRPIMTRDLIDRAWANLFVDDEEIVR